MGILGNRTSKVKISMVSVRLRPSTNESNTGGQWILVNLRNVASTCTCETVDTHRAFHMLSSYAEGIWVCEITEHSSPKIFTNVLKMTLSLSDSNRCHLPRSSRPQRVKREGLESSLDEFPELLPMYRYTLTAMNAAMHSVHNVSVVLQVLSIAVRCTPICSR